MTTGDFPPFSSCNWRGRSSPPMNTDPRGKVVSLRLLRGGDCCLRGIFRADRTIRDCTHIFRCELQCELFKQACKCFLGQTSFLGPTWPFNPGFFSTHLYNSFPS